MTYTITRSEPTYHDHVVAFGPSQNAIVFVGSVYPLTKERKRAMVRAVLAARDLPTPPDDLATIFDRNVFARYDDVTLTMTTVINDDDPADARTDLDLDYDRGSRSLDALTVKVVTL